MRTFCSRVTILVGFGVCGLAALGGCDSYHPGVYAGDGTMYAVPHTAPRYDLELDPVPLTRPGRYEFKLAALPTDNLLTLMSVDDPTPEKLAWIDRAGVRVGMTLMDLENDRTSIKYGFLTGEWNPTPESWNSQPVEYEGLWFRPSRHGAYTLIVDVWVDRPAANPPAINATPHVRGGGFGTH